MMHGGNCSMGSWKRNGDVSQKRQKAAGTDIRFHVLSILLVSFLCIICYCNALNAPFVFDDIPHIKNNQHIRLTRLDLGKLFDAGFRSPNPNRPVANVSLALNYFLFEYDPLGYRIFNITIHLFNGILVYFLTLMTLRNLTDNGRKQVLHSQAFSGLQSSNPSMTLIPLFSALLFIIHPVQVESVTYIVQRVNSMAAMFYLLSLLLYVKGRLLQQKTTEQGGDNGPSGNGDNQGHVRLRSQSLYQHLWFAGSLVAWLLALGSKQIAVTLPFFIFLYEWYFFQNLSKAWLKHHLRYLGAILAIFAFVALLFLGLSPLEKLQSMPDYSENAFTFAQRVLTQPRVVIYYLSLLVYPHPSRLNLDYDFPLSYSLITPITTLLCICAVICLIGLACCLARKERLISFSILWFFGNLALESTVIPLAMIFEHRTYLPSMLFFPVPVILVHRCLRWHRLWLALCCLASLLLLMATHQRNLVWENDLTLWTDVVAKSPNKARPHNNLGLAFARHGNPDAAITHYQKALQIDPEYSLAHLNWGVALTKLNQIDAAIEQFLLVLQMSPNDPEAHHYLGVAFFEKGMLQEAVAHNLEAVRLKPHFPEAYFKLGLFSAEGGKTEKAIGYYRQALRLKPDFAEAHINLGNLLAEGGKLQEAIWHYQRAKEYNPAMEAADLSLAQAYAKQGHSNKAIRTLQALLKLKPDFAEAHHALAMLLADGGDYDRAGTHYAKALDLDPDRAETHYNYGNLLAKQGGTAKAKEHYRAALAIDPSYADAHSNLGNILAMEGQMEEAIDQFLKALHHDPDLVAARSNLVKAYVLSGDHDAAMEQMEALKRLDPDEAALLQKLVTNQPQR